MKQVKINIYQFDELSEESKQKAVENLQDINVDYEWWGFVYMDAENIGLKITSFELDRKQSITGELLDSVGSICAKIIQEHGKQCDTYKLAQDYYSEKHHGRCRYTEESFRFALMEEYLSLLNQEYEYRISEKAIIEIIKANEYEFTENGKLY